MQLTQVTYILRSLGDSGGIIYREFSFLGYIFRSPKLRQYRTVKLRESCLFMAAKSTILNGSDSECIKPELVSNLLDLAKIHEEYLSAESNNSKFSHFLLQVVDSVFCKYS